MVTTVQPPLLVAAYAAGVLMFFSPCGVGLLPAYLTYFGTIESDHTGATDARHRRSAARLVSSIGAITFLGGAIPLVYMAVAGLRILLPGYEVIVPLAKLGTGSYLPSVVLVTVGTLLLANGAVAMGAGLRGAYVGIIATIGISVTYFLVGLPVVVLGQWTRSFVTPLELLAGPLLIAIGIAYYQGISFASSVPLPERGDRTTQQFFGFGIVYGIGSLACNLPVFLGVIVSAFVTEGIETGVGVFLAFIAGMATLLIGTSIAAASTNYRPSLGQYVGRARIAGSVAFVTIGAYVTWFSLRSFGYV